MNERKRAHQKIAASLATHTAPSTSLTTHNAQPVLHNNNEKKAYRDIPERERERESGTEQHSNSKEKRKSDSTRAFSDVDNEHFYCAGSF